MKRFAAAFGVILLLCGSSYAQDVKQKGMDLTLRGCVLPGPEAGTFLLTDVAEVHPDGKIVRPVTLSRPVVYWLDDAKGLRGHAERTVEVTGTIEDVRESVLAMKPGPHPEGGLIAASGIGGVDLDDPARAVGTSGSNETSVVVKVDVRDVKTISTSCH